MMLLFVHIMFFTILITNSTETVHVWVTCTCIAFQINKCKIGDGTMEAIIFPIYILLPPGSQHQHRAIMFDNKIATFNKSLSKCWKLYKLLQPKAFGPAPRKEKGEEYVILLSLIFIQSAITKSFCWNQLDKIIECIFENACEKYVAFRWINTSVFGICFNILLC